MTHRLPTNGEYKVTAVSRKPLREVGAKLVGFIRPLSSASYETSGGTGFLNLWTLPLEVDRF